MSLWNAQMPVTVPFAATIHSSTVISLENVVVMLKYHRDGDSSPVTITIHRRSLLQSLYSLVSAAPSALSQCFLEWVSNFCKCVVPTCPARCSSQFRLGSLLSYVLLLAACGKIFEKSNDGAEEYSNNDNNNVYVCPYSSPFVGHSSGDALHFHTRFDVASGSRCNF